MLSFHQAVVIACQSGIVHLLGVVVSELTAIVFMPVRAVMTAAPPKISIALTMILVRKQKKKKTRWAVFPQRACTISRTVCAEGAFILI